MRGVYLNRFSGRSSDGPPRTTRRPDQQEGYIMDGQASDATMAAYRDMLKRFDDAKIALDNLLVNTTVAIERIQDNLTGDFDAKGGTSSLAGIENPTEAELQNAINLLSHDTPRGKEKPEQHKEREI